jgi:hypothetical protein
MTSDPCSRPPRPAFERASPLARSLVAAAVQHIEAAGALDDAAELRQAFAAQPTRAAQVQTRAWLLGQRLGCRRSWRAGACGAAGWRWRWRC